MRARLSISPCVLVVVLLAGGCGGSGSPSTSPTSPSTTPPAAPSRPSGPGASACVEAWNQSSNSAAQKQLLEAFANRERGRVIVGSENGACVLAAYNVNMATYDVYRQSGDAFSRERGGQVGQFDQYKGSINAADVVVQPSGTVKPVR